MLILAGSICNKTYSQKIKYKKNLGVNWQKFKWTLPKYVICSQHGEQMVPQSCLEWGSQGRQCIRSMKFSLKKWECNEHTSTNITKTQEKHQFKDIHRPLTPSTDICVHLTMRCCVFTQRCGSVVPNVSSDLHFNSLYRPDEWDVQQSAGDRTQTDAVCVRRWICGSCRCSLMSHCSASCLLTPSNKGSKHIRGKRIMLVLSPQIWLQLSDNIC